MAEYTLTLTSEQAQAVLKSAELLMRLKINQPEGISSAVLDGMYKRIGVDEYCRRREKANRHLEEAFSDLFPSIADIGKDSEWYRLYNLYQVIRFAIHEAEHPESTGVDSYPPIQLSEEALPVCKWRNDDVHAHHKRNEA